MRVDMGQKPCENIMCLQVTPLTAFLFTFALYHALCAFSRTVEKTQQNEVLPLGGVEGQRARLQEHAPNKKRPVRVSA